VTPAANSPEGFGVEITVLLGWNNPVANRRVRQTDLESSTTSGIGAMDLQVRAAD
jgi:hypothetical protein